METKNALDMFAALGQETKLDVLRMLIRVGGKGMSAGEIAETLAVRPNTLSANLAQLRVAGLVHSERQGRSIRYFADFDGIRGLIGFLLEDCCGGRPELCQPLMAEVVCCPGDTS